MAADEGIEVESVLVERRRRRRGQRSTRPAGAASAPPCCWRRSPARAAERGRLRSRRSPRSHGASNERGRSLRRRADLLHYAGGRAAPTFDIAAGEIEFGIGIHGEPGRRRETLGTAHEIVAEMVEAILGTCSPQPERACSRSSTGMGGRPQLELLPALQRARAAAAPSAGLEIGAQPRRQLHHLASRWPARRSRVLELDDELPSALGRACPHCRRCAGARERRARPDDVRDDRHVALARRWLSARRARAARLPDAARRRDRRRRPRHQHGPWVSTPSWTELAEPEESRRAGPLLITCRQRRWSRLSAAPAARSGASALRRAGRSRSATPTSSTAPQLAAALDAALGGDRRSSAPPKPGDKTMVDALEPAVAALRSGVDGAGRLRRGRDRGRREPPRQGATATVPLQAPQGPRVVPRRALASATRIPGPRPRR